MIIVAILQSLSTHIFLGFPMEFLATNMDFFIEELKAERAARIVLEKNFAALEHQVRVHANRLSMMEVEASSCDDLQFRLTKARMKANVLREYATELENRS